MKMDFFKKGALVAGIFVMPSITLGADANNPAWQFDIAPYIWAANMNGRVASGPITAHMSENFADILSQLNVGGMLWLAAYKGPFGLFLNSMYIVLSDNAKVDGVTVDQKTRSGLFTAGLLYIILQKQIERADGSINQIQLQPYIGDRYTLNNVRINLFNLTINDNHHWQDPVIGLRMIYDWPRWVVQLSGDVGGTNAKTQYSYNWAALLGYKPASPSMKHVSFYLGYRNLYQVYKTGSGINYFNWSMRELGPVLGVNFNF
jgi:hypothetical protein